MGSNALEIGYTMVLASMVGFGSMIFLSFSAITFASGHIVVQTKNMLMMVMR